MTNAKKEVRKNLLTDTCSAINHQKSNYHLSKEIPHSNESAPPPSNKSHDYGDLYTEEITYDGVESYSGDDKNTYYNYTEHKNYYIKIAYVAVDKTEADIETLIGRNENVELPYDKGKIRDYS